MPLESAESKKTRLYVLEQYFLRNGTQPGRIHDWLRDGLLPQLVKIHRGPKIVLDALVAPHQPQVAFICGYESLAEWRDVSARLASDGGFRKKLEAWEEPAESPYENITRTLLETADYSPEITAPAAPPKASRIFELRVYHSPTWRQLKALHERFAGPEIRIFHRVGVRPVLYASTLAGSSMPNLVYLIPFDDLASREKAWNAFGADPEWVKVRKESIEQHGQISSIIQISLYRAAPYSPVR